MDVWPRGRSTAALADKVTDTARVQDILRVEVLSMRKVEDIEQQIRELSSAEFAELRNWVRERDWIAWDAQIEADANSGKLDKLVSEARADFDRGKARKL
jgi:hypothetical protein